MVAQLLVPGFQEPRTFALDTFFQTMPCRLTAFGDPAAVVMGYLACQFAEVVEAAEGRLAL